MVEGSTIGVAPKSVTLLLLVTLFKTATCKFFTVPVTFIIPLVSDVSVMLAAPVKSVDAQTSRHAIIILSPHLMTAHAD